MVTIPRGWYHFVHNQTACISVTLWAKLPRINDPLEKSMHVTSIAKGEKVDGSSHGLLSLPIGLLEHVTCFCMFSNSFPGNPVATSGVHIACRILHNVACSEKVWEFAFRQHWGAKAVLCAVPLGSCWRDRYSCISRMLIQEFRLKPKAALKKWQEFSLVDSKSSDDVAQFLHRYSHLLDQRQLGDYLADWRQSAILKSWTRELSVHFQGISLEAALRIYLMHIKLPGEAPKIDRMMEMLAQAYSAMNPDTAFSEDTNFILMFSMIMLNTDLHNPNIKNKTSSKDFIRNQRGINNGGDLPQEYLHEVYESIKQSPINI